MGRANLFVALAMLVAVAAAVIPMRGEAAVTCGSVQMALAPCFKYLTTPNASPDVKCCNGVKSLLKSAGTTADRQTACSCLKDAATKMTKIIPGNAVKLPSSCRVNIPYQISPNTNCKSIK